MKPFRVVVAGCGGMARVWVEYALGRPDVEIVGLVDIVAANAQAMAERYGLAVPVYTDLAEAIAATGANLVFDVTIPSSHREVVTTALGMGCHVFGEKPMATTWEDAKAIMETVAKSGRTYAVMQNRRYNKQIRALRRLVADGTIGQVGFVNADFFLGPHFGGFRDQMESPLIVDMAIHTFDQARFITGANPVSVYCHEFNPPGSWYQGNAAAVCIFELSDGSVFCYRGSWCAEGAPTSWEASWRVIGSRGTAIWDGRTPPFAEVVADGAEPKFFRDVMRVDVPLAWPGQEGHAGCLDEMFSALAAGRRPETDAHDNIHTVAMVYAALESARTGRKVEIRV
ncbi:oxidoreductase [Alicyclobacillus cellulosilyticus]|uniref:Oxidoreductase n=1 Tax=Alicyclobacillus cellulosilyticus TaxID=1003997 RepID=A0A917NL16_9BACL|nr:Gfo/Idh/MocA family oxidoreductase [Alicyclobacillus cellulosilyticus]GGJ08701.1 oxidoreductase [Alicyclobacillus cellulosilyticus]